MTAPDLDVVGLGNALVDVICLQDDSFLSAHGLAKGSMQLVDPEQAVALYRAMGPAEESSGGSAANTLAGVASLGGRAGFIGRISDDQLGEVFAHDIRAAGVEFVVPPARGGLPTGRSLIVVTPDAERTMSTLLGAASELTVDDVDADFVARGRIAYLEGYLFDQAAGGEAFAKAAEVAHGAHRHVALTLSDSFCVERFLEGFRDLVARSIDILIGNEDELCLLYETTDVEVALERAAKDCDLVAVTLGARGAAVAANGTVVHVAADPVADVVDTTGAGDLFAAGFLFGLTHSRDVGAAARIGGIAAGEVISHVGARPLRRLADLL